MGANAVTTVPVYTAGEVLTAADMNITNSGIPVFATTVTRDAAFGGTGEKTLAEGQFAYIEATNTTQYYDGAAWQPVGVAPGLVLISTTTIGSAVSSVEVTGAFSSTYDDYKIMISGGTGSNASTVTLQMGATTTGYYAGYSRVVYSTGAASLASDNNAASFTQAGNKDTDAIHMNVEIQAPNLAKKTVMTGNFGYPVTTGLGAGFGGFLNNTTAYTAFTVAASSGTMTGGTIRVYGYANS